MQVGHSHAIVIALILSGASETAVFVVGEFDRSTEASPSPSDSAFVIPLHTRSTRVMELPRATGNRNIILNPGFETGDLNPWYQNGKGGTGKDWHVTDEDAHTGTYSATAVYGRALRQDFDPIPVEDILEISYWIKMTYRPITSTYTFYYSDGTQDKFDTDDKPGPQWGQIYASCVQFDDDETELFCPDRTKQLVGLQIGGCFDDVDCRTNVDDVIITLACYPPDMDEDGDTDLDDHAMFAFYLTGPSEDLKPPKGENILVNPGFEDGVLDPWYRDGNGGGTELWHVSGDDPHTGLYSATATGLATIRQDFDPVPVENILELSYWIKMTDTLYSDICFAFSDNTRVCSELFSAPGPNWGRKDTTCNLCYYGRGKELVSLIIPGCIYDDYCRTTLDDVTIRTRPPCILGDMDKDGDLDLADFASLANKLSKTKQ